MLERKRTRLREFDYSSPNYYFITISTNDKKSLFGSVNNGTMHLNENGKIVEQSWMTILNHFLNVEIDKFIIMPNHFHGILIMNGVVGLRSPQPYIKTKKFSLSQIIAYFKYESTKRINECNKAIGNNIWQRSFYDRIIRNEKELYNIRNYIHFNALKWNSDFGDENLEL
jgi:REP element-mobilizing transposase RayT